MLANQHWWIRWWSIWVWFLNYLVPEYFSSCTWRSSNTNDKCINVWFSNDSEFEINLECESSVRSLRFDFFLCILRHLRRPSCAWQSSYNFILDNASESRKMRQLGVLMLSAYVYAHYARDICIGRANAWIRDAWQRHQNFLGDDGVDCRNPRCRTCRSGFLTRKIVVEFEMTFGAYGNLRAIAEISFVAKLWQTAVSPRRYI